MRLLLWMALLAPPLVAQAVADPDKEIFRNEKAVVLDTTFGVSTGVVVHNPACVVTALEGGALRITPEGGQRETVAVKRGDVSFWPGGQRRVQNGGRSEVRYIRTCFLSPGRPQDPPWGSAGLSPNYKLLLENQYARVYEIRIAAGTKEPLHSHKDRVVVCLSGAEMQHILPDGRTETSSLKTNEAVWRKGGTHIGQNLGKTDLWVIAVEPK